MVNELKPCPLCGKHPHHGLGKLQHCQLHGEPFQNFRIWCTAGHAQVEEASRELAFTAWNTRADTGRLSEMEAEVARLREALTPSGDTKGAYSGEFTFTDSTIYVDEDGEEHQREIMVPWATIKEIMKAISARAALRSQS